MIEQFLDYLRYEKNRSQQTIERYGRSLRGFEAYFKGIEEDLGWTTVDSDVIRAWMEALMDGGNTASTVGTAMSALRSFYRFALARGLTEHNPAAHIQAPKKRRPLPGFLKESEMDRLIDEMEWGDTFKDVRARTIILMFYETGLRRGELSGLDDSDVDMQSWQLKVTGKRDKQRIVPFGAELHSELERYIDTRDRTVERNTTALFVDNHGSRMNGAQVYYEVRKHLGQVTTMKKHSPHVLRHTYATALLNHKAGLESVRRLLGHESLKTTEIYTHTTFEQLKRVYKDAHPRG